MARLRFLLVNHIVTRNRTNGDMHIRRGVLRWGYSAIAVKRWNRHVAQKMSRRRLRVTVWIGGGDLDSNIGVIAYRLRANVNMIIGHRIVQVIAVKAQMAVGQFND